jgi:tetratricopeptide (TPR) repeat protein
LSSLLHGLVCCLHFPKETLAMKFLRQFFTRPASQEPEAAPSAPVQTPSAQAAAPGAAEQQAAQRARERETWRRDAFPKAFEAAKEHPERCLELASHCLSQGFSEEGRQVAEALLKLEPGSLRAIACGCAARRACGDAAGARQDALRGLEIHPQAAVLMATLARCADDLHEDAEAERLIWETLALDPDHEGLFTWASSRAAVSGGDGAGLAVLERVAALPGSRRVHLWLARQALRRGDKNSAIQLQLKGLDLLPTDAEALTMATGDLGRAGHLQEVVELGLRRYQPRAHGPWVGCNMIQALLGLGRVDEAEDLLHKLFLSSGPQMMQPLMQISGQIAELRQHAAGEWQAEQRKGKGAAPDRIEFLRLSKPVWWHALNEPNWMLPERPAAPRRVAFVTIADVTKAGEDMSRFTRAIPAFLAELLGTVPAIETSVLIPVVRGGGPLVHGQEWEPKRLKEIVAMDSEFKPEFLVSGFICRQGEGFELRLRVFESSTLKEVRTLHKSGLRAKLGQSVGEMAEDLARQFTASNVPVLYPEPPPAQLAEAYLSGCSQLLTLFLGRIGAVPAELRWGDRESLAWFADFALRLKADMPRIQFLAACALERGGGGPIHREFAPVGQALARGVDGKGAFHRYLPMLFSLFGQTDLARSAADKISASGCPASYSEWLQRVLPPVKDEAAAPAGSEGAKG